MLSIEWLFWLLLPIVVFYGLLPSGRRRGGCYSVCAGAIALVAGFFTAAPIQPELPVTARPPLGELSCHGVRPGMTQSDATALLGPGVVVEDGLWRYRDQVMVEYDAHNQVVGVHGKQLESEGHVVLRAGDPKQRLAYVFPPVPGQTGQLDPFVPLYYRQGGVEFLFSVEGDRVSGIVMDTVPASTGDKPSQKKVKTKIQLYRDNGRGKPGQAVTYFDPSDHVQHMIAPHSAGDRIPRIRWVCKPVKTGNPVRSRPRQLTSSRVGDEARATVSLERDWPWGLYRAELYVDGELQASRNYVISQPVEKLRVRHFSRLLDTNGRPGPPAQVMTPKERTVHFEALLDGYLMGETHVVWKYLRVDPSTGSQTVFFEQASDLRDERSNSLTSYLTATRDWIPGPYRVELYLNGRKVGHHDYSVKVEATSRATSHDPR
ncbi:MAG: hypothetical protein HY319_24550 [Armatimonadetes bacterium]|nr:hypothetical protein [Armatimonadota bacterium]